jgi:hypothetical protein
MWEELKAAGGAALMEKMVQDLPRGRTHSFFFSTLFLHIVEQGEEGVREIEYTLMGRQ